MTSRTNDRLFLQRLKLTFLHITRYELDYTWEIRPTRRLPHDVLWRLEEGGIQLTVDGKTYEASEGDTIILPAESEIASHAVTTRLRLTSVNFIAAFGFAGGRKWTDAMRLPLVFGGHEEADVGPIFESLLANADKDMFAREMLLQAGFEMLFALMLNRYFEDERVKLLPELDPRVQAIMAYLSLHPHYSGDVAGLCDRFQVSESYLRKLFVEGIGIGPLAYMHQSKIDAAQEKLVSGMDKISEIAYSLGFQDANYFSRLFRRKTGYSPLDYRNTFRRFSI